MKPTDFPTAIWSDVADDLDDPANCVQGVANLTDKGVVLEIPFGYLGATDQQIGFASTKPHFDYLFGMTVDGKYLALLDAREQSSTMHFGKGFARQTLAADWLLASSSPIDPALKICSVEVTACGLREWLNNPPFDVTSTLRELDGRLQHEATELVFLSDKTKQKELYRSGTETIAVDTSVSNSGSINGGEWHITYDNSLCYHSAAPMSFDVAIDKAFKLADFVSLMTGRTAAVRSISVKFENQDYWVKCYASLTSSEYDDDPEIHAIPFPISSFSDAEVAEALDKWMHCDKYVNQATKMMLAALSERKGYLQSSFFMSSQMLETFAYNGKKTQALPQEEVERRLKTLLNGVTDPEICEWATCKLKGMNTVSSKQLLGELIKELSPASSLLIGDTDQFLKKQHAYRNACAHPSIYKEKGLQGEDIFYHTRLIVFLGYMAALYKLGLSPEKIEQRLKDSNYQWWLFNRIRRLYPAE